MIDGKKTTPGLHPMPLNGFFDLSYTIDGDPDAAPTHVVGNGRNIDLEWEQDDTPPISLTRAGQLHECAIVPGSFVTTPKVDPMTLQPGPRVAMVDGAKLETFNLAGSSGPLRNVATPKWIPAPRHGSALMLEPPATSSPPAISAMPAPLFIERKAAVAVERRTLDLFEKKSAKRSLAAARRHAVRGGLCHAPTVCDLAAAQALRSMLEAERKDLRMTLSAGSNWLGPAVLERVSQGSS